MINKTNHSQLPPEEKEIHLFSKQIESKYIAREKSNLANYEESSEDKKIEMLIERNKKIEKVVKKKILSWREYNWTEHKALVYLAARLAPNYQATKFVFNEIKHVDPEFEPKTLFDFGSGLGTTMHVANDVWPSTVYEHLNIDSSKEMNDLSDLLLKDGNENNSRIFNNVFYKQFLPVTHKLTYDLVVSAFSLKELPSVDARLHVIENLWHKTKDILVFIEHGNQAGTAAILEARSFILKMNGYDPIAIYNPEQTEDEKKLDASTKNPNVHIMAPCPHHYCCPRLNKENNLFCNFSVNYYPISYGQNRITLERERLSYVVFRKRPKTYTDFPAWPRVVRLPKKSSKLVNLKLCTPEGKIEELNVSKGKSDKNAYDCARACKWGDTYGVKITEMDKIEYKTIKLEQIELQKSDLNNNISKIKGLTELDDDELDETFEPEDGDKDRKSK